MDSSPTKVQISFAGTKHVYATAAKAECFFDRILIQKLLKLYDIFTLKIEFMFLKHVQLLKNKLMYNKPAYSFQSELWYTFQTKKAEDSR